MVISSVDIGTNTVLLLIAQTDPKNNKIIPLLNEYRIPRIGKNVSSTGKISDEAVHKLKNVLLQYLNISEKFHSEVFIASATAAFRNANNSDYVIKNIFRETGIRINIISGDEEARYAYLGVTGGVEDNKERLIIDIGGGSTEIISGKNKELLFTKSVNSGVVTARELYYKSSNLINDLNDYFTESFSTLKEIKSIPGESYAIAGTPTTLAAIKHNLSEFDESVDGTILSQEDVTKFIRAYSDSPEYYIKKFNKILSGREDLMIPGSLILFRIMENLGIDKIIVSTRGIRHGAILNYLDNYG